MAIRATSSTTEEGELVESARGILSAEAASILKLVNSLDHNFATAVHLVLNCSGKVLVTGMGKAGLVGQKLAASFASTGTPSLYFHPAEAVHGDLGCISPNDLVVVLSYSGETEEIVRILPQLHSLSTGILAITSRVKSSLGRAAKVTLELGEIREAGALTLAPSTTTTAMMALGDALALVVSERRSFTREQFARFHPAGNLGRMLTNVREVMRPLAECRVAGMNESVRRVLIAVSRPGRRTGAIMLVNEHQQLAGIFTDSDLARLLECSQDSKLDQAIGEVMTRKFTTICDDQMLPDALRLLAERKISELPVVDSNHVPVGMIDITDVVSVVSSKLDDAAAGTHNACELQPPGEAIPNLRVVRHEG